jgi:hypothetical protein
MNGCVHHSPERGIMRLPWSEAPDSNDYIPYTQDAQAPQSAHP